MIKAITTYLRLLTSLFTSVRSYHQFLILPKSQVLGTLAIGLLVLSLIWLTRIYLRVMPQAIARTDQAITEFVSYYPTDLVVSWDGQQLTTEPSGEYQVYFPSFYSRPTNDLPDRVLYYHPRNLSLEEVKARTPVSSYFVVTPTTLYSSNQVGEWSTESLDNSPGFEQPFTFTKKDLTTAQAAWQANSTQFWHLVKIGLAVLAPIYVLLSTAWSGLVLYLITYALVVMLYRWPLNARQLARLVAPVCLVAAAVHLIGQLLYQRLDLPLFSLTYWLVLLWTLRTLPVIQLKSTKRR